MNSIHLSKNIARKSSISSFCIIIWMFCIILRLFYLQIIHQNYFFYRAQTNFLRIEPIPAPRGNIIDCTGKYLATNRPILSVYWNGTGNTILTTEQRDCLEVLEKILNKQIYNQNSLSQIKKWERSHKKGELFHDISFEQLSKIEELFANHPNISIETDFKRFYPYATSASHIIGYLDRKKAHTEGKMGLELVCNNILIGTPGLILKTINSVGTTISESIIQNQIPGSDIHTTINIDLQRISETIFSNMHTGALIIMDPQDGAIRSLVSTPSFKPEAFLDPISSEAWSLMQENNPFLNRTVMAYPPGSIFKLVTISAALEHNLVREDDTWMCRGYSTFANRKYWCHKHSGHGLLDTTHAVGHSCNILFFEIGKKLDIDLLATYAKKFGLGERTGIVISDKDGLVPTHAWKREVKREPWWPGETLSASIGQSYLLVTPLQVARMISAIFTKKLVKPRLLQNEPLIESPLILKNETIEFLKKSMRAVITHGTGKQVNKLKDIEIYAKTSTAQTSALGTQSIDRSHIEHGWFVTHFQYKNERPLVMVILVEHAGSSQVPTIMARNFLIQYKKLCDEKK